MAKGIGYAMCVLNFFTGLYYNTIISWAVFFFVESFTLGSLPWTSCNNLWNAPTCRTIEQRQDMSQSVDVDMSNFSSPTRDYFE
jgi:SNF family Na+-dependent transporter